jgi:hypothetical protein
VVNKVAVSISRRALDGASKEIQTERIGSHFEEGGIRN